MSSYKPIDSKREEFRKYLERTGVMDALTKALVALYEETDKPEDALGYIRSYLGGGSNEEPAKGTQKQEDVKVKPEKTEGSIGKESGEKSSLQAEDVKQERDSKLGAAGDVPTISTKANGDKSVNEGTGKAVAESVPPDGAA